MPPTTRPRRLRAANDRETRAATSAVWPVMEALGTADPQHEVVLSQSYTVTGKQIQAAATVADKLLRAEESRAYAAERDLEVVREQRDRALLLLRRIDAEHSGLGGLRGAELGTLLAAARDLTAEVGVLALDRDVRAALAGVLAEGPALEAAVAAALDAAVLAPPSQDFGARRPGVVL